jgi:hypothetical protein
MTKTQTISRKKEGEILIKLFAKKRKPYDVFLGKKVVDEVVNRNTALQDISVLEKYCPTKKLKKITLSFYLSKMGDAVLSLAPEKRKMAKTYYKMSQNCLLEALLEK